MPNSEVTALSNQRQLSHLLAKQQLLLFGRVARAPASDLLRDCGFCPGSLRPATDRYVRKRGRPRLEWISHVLNLAMRMTGSMRAIEDSACSEPAWRNLVTCFCNEHDVG